MLTGVYQSAMIVLTTIVFYVMDVYLMRRYDPCRDYGSSRNRIYTVVVIVVMALIIAQPVIWPELSLRIYDWWGLLVQAAGGVSLLAALALNFWARTHIRQFYAERSSDIQASQHLVDTGPYAHVRHPIYTSYFMLAIGVALINPSVPTMLLLIYSVVDFSLAPLREEKLLVENVPGYDEYRKRTPRFFPRLRRRPSPGDEKHPDAGQE